MEWDKGCSRDFQCGMCVCVCFLLYDYDKNSGMLICAALSAAKRDADMTIKVSDHESNYQGKRRNIHHTSKPLSNLVSEAVIRLIPWGKLCFGGLLKRMPFLVCVKEASISGRCPSGLPQYVKSFNHPYQCRMLSINRSIITTKKCFYNNPTA